MIDNFQKIFIVVISIIFVFMITTAGGAVNIDVRGELETVLLYQNIQDSLTEEMSEILTEQRVDLRFRVDDDLHRGVLAWEFFTEEKELNFYETYLDLMLPDFSFLRVGRQDIRQGEGFAWNPTTFIEVSNKVTGSGFVKKDSSMAVNYTKNLRDYSAVFTVIPEETLENIHLRGSLSRGLFTGDLTATFYYNDGKKGLGSSFLFPVVGDLMMYNETSWKWDFERQYVSEAGQVETRTKSPYIHNVLGVYNIFSDNSFFTAEYYFNNEGWDEQEATNYFAFRPEPEIDVPEGRMRRNYLYFQYTKPDLIGSIDVSSGLLFNIDDSSFLFTPGFSYEFTDNIDFSFDVQHFGGSSDSEYGALPYDTSVKAAISLFF